MNRPATPEDVAEICASLPETELGLTWIDVPTWRVPRGDRGRGFLRYRPPHRSALDPATGEPFEDLLVIDVPDAGVKAALVNDPRTPFFTIDHFRNTNSVLIQQSRLGELGINELREVITDAWVTRAPKRLAAAFLADQLARADSDDAPGAG